MFPIQIEPGEALKELVDFNRKLVKGIDSIADVHEVDVAPTPREVVYRGTSSLCITIRPEWRIPTGTRFSSSTPW